MIAKRTIIGVFLNSHDLNAVIAISYDTWQHIFLKLTIGAHTFGVLRHTDMAFIYQQR